MLSDQTKPPFWRYDAVGQNLLMSSYHLSDANLYRYYKKLVAYKPDEIFTYPSSIFPIANFIKTRQLPKLKLKLVMTTAEPLLDYQREVIESAFDANIVNQYGCTEMAFFAEQSADNRMRFNPEHGIVEVLDANGSIENNGSGELIATGIVNRSMPIIRYRLGDSVELTEIKSEAWGAQAYASLVSFTGRTDDLIYTKNGTPVGRLDPVFKGGSNIKAAQIIQLKSGDINLLLEPDEHYTDSDGVTLKTELQKRVGSGIEISVFTDREIKKMANGKFKFVCSMR
jgi:phenylacetate-CoA ligase